MSVPQKLFPLFPLSILPLPGERLVLHIFEPRYQELFHQLERMEFVEFGIPCQLPGQDLSHGSIMRLVVSEPPDSNGRRNVVVVCVGLFKLLKYFKEPPDSPFSFPSGELEVLRSWKHWSHPASTLENFNRWIELTQNHHKINGQLSIVEQLSTMQLSPLERLQIVSAKDNEQRNLTLARIVQYHLLIAEQIHLKKDGYFPN